MGTTLRPTRRQLLQTHHMRLHREICQATPRAKVPLLHSQITLQHLFRRMSTLSLWNSKGLRTQARMTDTMPGILEDLRRTWVYRSCLKYTH